jgi:transcriptional regulator with XRE-family HTH domain
MARSTQMADLFRSPALVAQRNYEICKAYYLDQTTAEQLAERFGLHPDSVRAIVRDFAHDPDLEQFFVVNRPGRQTAPKRDALSEDVIRLRQQGLTLAQIQQRLHEQGHSISESYLSRILAGHDLPDVARLRPAQAATARQAKDGSEIPAAADARLCSFEPVKGFEKASPYKLFRKFVDTTGCVEIEEDKVIVRLVKRAHNPVLKEAGLTGPTPPVPWLGNRPLVLQLP